MISFFFNEAKNYLIQQFDPKGYLKHTLLGLLCFLSTLVNVPVKYCLIIISIIGFSFLINCLTRKKITNNDYLLFSFFLTSLIIFVVGFFNTVSYLGKSSRLIIPYSLFIITTIFFSKYINSRVLVVILYLILFEVIVGIYEYTIGELYLIKPIGTQVKPYFNKFTSSLYSYRVYGLSNSSSIFSQKIFIGIMLLFFLKKIKYKYLLLFILLIGLILVFNRTAILSVFIFLILRGIIFFKKNGLFINRSTITLYLPLIFGFFFLVLFYFETISSQFIYWNGKINLSERDLIYVEYINFIRENFFWGNFTNKYWILIEDRLYHAHNSYLSVIASMGFFSATLLFFYIYRLINKKNILYIAPILIYSIFQYGILWGVSLLDIVFFYFIFNSNSEVI